MPKLDNSYPTLPLPYPTQPHLTQPYSTLPQPTPPWPIQPHPTPPLPHPTLPYPTLPYPTHTPTPPLPYHILPTLTLPYPIPHHPTPPWPTQPHPYPTLLFILKRKFYLVWNHSIKATGTVRVFHSVTSDRRVQCSRVGLEIKIYDTPAGGLRASQGTFSSFMLRSGCAFPSFEPHHDKSCLRGFQRGPKQTRPYSPRKQLEI